MLLFFIDSLTASLSTTISPHKFFSGILEFAMYSAYSFYHVFETEEENVNIQLNDSIEIEF